MFLTVCFENEDQSFDFKNFFLFRIPEEIFMCETRPALQGARLSAYEAVVEKWPNAHLVSGMKAGDFSSNLFQNNGIKK